jgi:hypothetical protein
MPGPDPKGIDALGSLKVERISEVAAGYMELRGAKKDADCRKVAVNGGVSSELGCCNLFEADNEKVQEFECGQCEYVRNVKRS